MQGFNHPLAIGVLVLAAIASSPVLAAEAGAPTPQDAVNSEQDVVLAGLLLDGMTAYQPTDFAPIYEPYLARTIQLEDLTSLAQAISERYRKDGYFLTQVVVPEQPDLKSGFAHIAVLEGHFSDVTIEGPARDIAAPYFKSLTTSGPAKLHDLRKAILRAQNVPGLVIKTRIEPDPTNPSLHRLVVTAAMKSVESYIELSDRGTSAVGPWQAVGETRFNSVFKGGDQISAFYFTTPQDPREYSSLGLGYGQTLLNGASWSISGSYGQNRNDSAPVILRGRTSIVSASIAAPLVQEPSKFIALQVRFDATDSRNNWIDRTFYDDQTRVARIGLRGFTKEDGRSASIFVSASFGLDALGASGKSALNRSRYNAPPNFTKLNLQTSYYQALGPIFGLLLRADAQWSRDPLLLSEQFALGGVPFGRAYDFGELTGDSGIAGSVELRAGIDPNLPALDYLQGYAFLDGGQTWFSGEDQSYSLSSAGVGARIGVLDRYSLGLETAKPLTRTPYGELDKEWRRSVTLSAQY